MDLGIKAKTTPANAGQRKIAYTSQQHAGMGGVVLLVKSSAKSSPRHTAKRGLRWVVGCKSQISTTDIRTLYQLKEILLQPVVQLP